MKVIKSLKEDLLGAESDASGEASRKNLKTLIERANRGDSQAMVDLAVRHVNGIGVSRDTQKAKSYLSQAVQQDNVTAMLYMGNFYEYGLDEFKDAKDQQHLAATNYKAAADAGNGTAAHLLATMVMERRAPSRLFTSDDNPDEVIDPGVIAVHLYRTALTSGVRESKLALALLYREGHFPANMDQKRADSEAVQLLQSAREDGNLNAVPALAMMHMEGRGVDGDLTANRKSAVLMLQQGCDAGNAMCQSSLANILIEGTLAGRRPQSLDDAKAETLLRSAVRQNDPAAYAGLALLYREGRIQQTRIGDIFNLSRLNIFGKHEFADIKAAQLFEKGAMLGEANCQCELGIMLYKGRGVAADDEKAIE